jgi:saccharopine dehydrogenase (NAD+, L-lysine-forming)
MAKAIVLGGCGAVGSVTVRTLAETDTFSDVVIADYNGAKAEQLASELGGGVSAVQVDATHRKSVKDAIKGCDVVVNCVGPFYSTVKPILGAVIESGINYVDVCDDPDVTLEILDMDEQAKKAGISALIGMGGSPGTTNLLAMLIYRELLDETDSIDIFHTHGGELTEGEGVIGHRFHCMSIDIPMFLDGELKYVKYFEEDGIALRQTFDFPAIGDDIPLYPYPHPEQLTLPRYMKVRQVTNKGSVLPIEYYQLTSELCRLGLGSKEALEVRGQKVVPYDFAVAYLLRERERMLKETDFGHRRGSLSLVAKGRKDNEDREYRIHAVSTKLALGEGTGIPAAAGAIFMQRGKITTKGVIPPEACIDPREYLELVKPLMGIKDTGGKPGDSSFLVERVDKDGNVTLIDVL